MVYMTLRYQSNAERYCNSYAETWPRFLRMANLAVIGSFKVNGVAELHSQLVKVHTLQYSVGFPIAHFWSPQTTILKEFSEFYPGKFGNITNGITPRRWLDQCNPGLSALITETLGGKKDAWLKDLNLLKGLTKYEDDPAFQKKWHEVKLQNKERLARESPFHRRMEYGSDPTD